MSKLCESCGQVVFTNDKFCGGCGAQVNTDNLICSECSDELSNALAFCPNCGSKNAFYNENPVQPQSTQALPAETDNSIISDDVSNPPEIQTFQNDVEDDLNTIPTQTIKKKRAIAPIILTSIIVIIVAVFVYTLFTYFSESSGGSNGYTPSVSSFYIA